MSDGDPLIVMCAYLTHDRLAALGNVPTTCALCTQAIVVSKGGLELLRKRNGKPVCPTCMAEHAPDDATPLVPEEQRLMLLTLGMPEEFIAEQEAMPIKELATLIRDHHRGTALN